MTDTTQLLEIAAHVAEEAAELARMRRIEGVSVAASKSTAVDIVTHADREVEALIRGRLAEARPDDGFFGEESGAEAGSSGLTWVVDPIDGTVNYLYGIPQYAVSIAVVEGEADPLSWRALAGVVVNPELGERFAATVGGGSTLNGRGIRVTTDVSPDRALIGTGFGYRPEVRVRQAETIVPLISQVRDIRRMGAASLDLCGVACGRIDGYFERGLQPWDHAAGVLIAAEAGARVSGWRGAPPSAEFTLAADAPLAEFLEKSLLNAAADWAD
ncbi:inositol monophosphatase [Salinibacterium sp. SYSU T00001]|uniref:inositol monophosphatase family protein n=1 Tax=Homoserinimonas sedimenticola TaxID=2986805 RepID=UPI002236619F|nr:inositol monophosphatase family protein [Salinibacterium sedimenticola]MCW4385981.1 inositol monophosphatase [Salinibacterium sedimenticola]